MAKVSGWLTSEDSTFWPVLGKLGSAFGIVATIGAIIGLAKTGKYAVPALIMSIYMCVLVTVLLFLLMRQERRYLREARYAAALLPLRKAFSEIASATWHLFNDNTPSEDAFRIRLRDSLRWLAESFTLITGSQCRACIKLIQAPADVASNHDFLVSTLCRDNEGAGPPRHSPDRIGDNTDFRQILAENSAAFFSNDLESMLAQGYRNSHWTDEVIRNKSFDYLATIVWPIEQGATSPYDKAEQREIIGFLCIDTLTKGAFVKTYDEALGASFSRALYLALHRFRAIISSSAASATEKEV